MARVGIIGGGAIGLCAAHYLQAGGHDVTIFDANGLVSGASSGNAGNFATYACIPINNPSVFGSLHRHLLSATSPLRLRWPHLPFMTGWLLAFLKHSGARRSRAATLHLASLLAAAAGGFGALLDRVGRDLVAEREPLLLYSSTQALHAAQAGLALRRRLGIPFQAIGPAEILEREPALKPMFVGGISFTGAWHFRSPYLFLKRLGDDLAATGAAVVQDAVSAVQPSANGARVVLSGGGTVRFDTVVVAAGAHSRRLAAQCGDAVPLETERGYHLTFGDGGHLVSRPCGWSERGLYMTPMLDGLRVAGTVELGGTSPVRNASLLSLLATSAREALPTLDGPSTTWLGLRPSMPDGLPVIGRSAGSSRVIYAFGHQHLGLTLAGVTGQIIAALVDGRPPPLDIAAYAPGRFRIGHK